MLKGQAKGIKSYGRGIDFGQKSDTLFKNVVDNHYRGKTELGGDAINEIEKLRSAEE